MKPLPGSSSFDHCNERLVEDIENIITFSGATGTKNTKRNC